MTGKTSEPNSEITPENEALEEQSTHDAGASAARAHHRKERTPDSSYQNYLFGSAGASDTPAWSDSARGRFAIRTVSRGIVGAAFFVIGGRMASQQLQGYNEHHWKWDSSKPLQAIAKGFDVTLGKGIKKTVGLIARVNHTPAEAEVIAKRAVTFRETRKFAYRDKDGKLKHTLGRSYGADIVGFTFDFAMASIGDAGTRNIIQALDPNVKKTWKVNDEGNPAAKGERWHFVPGEWLKSTAKTTWRVMTKNQGEDWAAAIPYAFQMKFQRQFLSNVFNKRWAGHQLVFDHSWNGGAWRVNQQGKIVGDFQLAGAIDLHARFVGYNWYTLMFREGYDRIGNALTKWKDDGFTIRPHMPEHFNPITDTLGAVGDTARYVTKSFIKANMYMNPAVVPFWLMRVPQSKWRGKFFVEPGQTHFDNQTSLRTHIWGESNHGRGVHPSLKPFDPVNYEHYPTATKLDRFEKGFSRVLNPLGAFSFKAGTKAADFSQYLAGKGFTPKAKWARKFLQGDQNSLLDGGRRFAHEVVDASLSYTPYMYAKQELGLRVDDTKGDGNLGQMDKAIYQFMDDVAGFRFGSVGKDMKLMWKLGTNFERDVKVREGDTVDSQNIAKAQTPRSKVHANTVHHDPVQAVRAPNDPDAANDPSHDHSWVKSVVGSDVHPSRIHSANQTRH